MFHFEYKIRVDYEFDTRQGWDNFDKEIMESPYMSVNFYGGTPASSPYLTVTTGSKKETYRLAKYWVFKILCNGGKVL